MSTEQTVKDKTVQPNGCLSFLKQAVVPVLTLAALAGIFIAGTMYSDVAQSLSSEPVYEAMPEQVNPALEGKLVKMRVTELVAEGGPLTDETFGLRKENTIALHRYYLPLRKGRINVSYRELHGIRESWVLAPRVKAGAYTLRAREIFWEDLGGEYLNPDEMTLPAAWEGRVVSRTAHGITLRTDDTSNLAAPNADFHYMRIPSPWRGVRHMVGRQQGNVLDLTGEGCGLIRGEEQYQQWSRMRPAVGLLLMPVREYCFYILCLQGAITLCLLPGVLLMQKRGWVRATYVSILLGVLLTALVASAFWLLPYSEYNRMTWIYTLVPGLIAFVLLGLVCRKKILKFVLKYIHKMTKPPILRILATSALCLAAGSGTLTASEWKNHYPEEAVIIQGVSSQITADLDESSVLYSYFAADSKIAYIEESFSTSMVFVCIRYLFDESGDFVAAACRISTQSVFSDEWTHSQMILVRGQHLKVERCGISEAIDERAKHIMKRCLADWKQQSKKIRK